MTPLVNCAAVFSAFAAASTAACNKTSLSAAPISCAIALTRASPDKPFSMCLAAEEYAFCKACLDAFSAAVAAALAAAVSTALAPPRAAAFATASAAAVSVAFSPTFSSALAKTLPPTNSNSSNLFSYALNKPLAAAPYTSKISVRCIRSRYLSLKTYSTIGGSGLSITFFIYSTNLFLMPVYLQPIHRRGSL